MQRLSYKDKTSCIIRFANGRSQVSLGREFPVDWRGCKLNNRVKETAEIKQSRSLLERRHKRQLLKRGHRL